MVVLFGMPHIKLVLLVLKGLVPTLSSLLSLREAQAKELPPFVSASCAFPGWGGKAATAGTGAFKNGDTIHLASSDSEENGIALGNAPGARGMPCLSFTKNLPETFHRVDACMQEQVACDGAQENATDEHKSKWRSCYNTGSTASA